MQNHPTKSMLDYCLSVLWFFFILFLFYKSILFRILPHRNIAESRMILLILTAASVLLCSLVFRRRRTGWLSFACLILPFGLYTIAAYFSTFRPWILTVTLGALLLAALYVILVLSARIRRNGRAARRRILRLRLSRCVYGAFCIAAVALLLLMAGIGWNRLFGASLLSSAVPAEAVSEDAANAQTIQGNIDTVLKLQPEIWETQSTQERLDILQTICNIESTYLGLSPGVTVGANVLPESTLGTYDDDLRLIQIDLDHMEQDDVEEVLDTLLHEVYHCYEYRLSEAYNEASPEMKNLRLFRDASRYAEESEHYIDPDDDYWGYASQRLELDSESYASASVQDYYDRIEAWLDEQASGAEDNPA